VGSGFDLEGETGVVLHYDGTSWGPMAGNSDRFKGISVESVPPHSASRIGFRK
jgi:hypothetical protein